VRNGPATRHSSFHTTFNVLEGLRIAAARKAIVEPGFREAEARAADLMLQHRLFRSDRTGEVISEGFAHLTYPWHWHYTVLRGLDYLRLTPAYVLPRPWRRVRGDCSSACEHDLVGRFVAVPLRVEPAPVAVPQVRLLLAVWTSVSPRPPPNGVAPVG
jgi:hypothetical protein